MEVQPPADQQAIIQGLVASGRFPSVEDVISEGVRLLASTERFGGLHFASPFRQRELVFANTRISAIRRNAPNEHSCWALEAAGGQVAHLHY